MAILDYVIVLDSISQFQGHMNWNITVSKAHAGWIRATIGAAQVDDLYDENRKGAEAVGFPFGLYHVFKPDKNFQKQAEVFAAHCGHWDDPNVMTGDTYHLDTPLFPMFDIELTGGLDKQALDNACQKFLAYFIKITGTQLIPGRTVFKAIIYTGAWFFDPNLPRNDWAKTFLGDFAYYRDDPEPQVPLDWANRNETWTLWQRWGDGDRSGATYGASSPDICIAKFNGSISDFEKLFNVTLKEIGTVDTKPLPTPPALPQAASLYSGLRIRNKPTTVNSLTLAYLAKNENVDVIEVIQSSADVWYRIGHNQFCARHYNGRDYMMDL